jgi:hypothetical protein
MVADLTESVPAGADVYMLKKVLHGFKDAEAIAILKNCRAVVPQAGTLLVIEFILPRLVSQVDPDLEGHLMSDLGMLAITGGEERSEREWRALIEGGGFQSHPSLHNPLRRSHARECWNPRSKARSEVTASFVRHRGCS